MGWEWDRTTPLVVLCMSAAGLPDDDKFGKYCQKSLFSKNLPIFWQRFFKAKNLPFLKYQL